jgi:hypothetical protein
MFVFFNRQCRLDQALQICVVLRWVVTGIVYHKKTTEMVRHCNRGVLYLSSVMYNSSTKCLATSLIFEALMK